jgi:hypothetical protein
MGLHPASYSGVTDILSSRKAAVAYCYSLASSAEVKKEWSYTRTPAIRLHGVGNHNL